MHGNLIRSGLFRKLEIKYSTAKEATALQFLDKELTADKKVSFHHIACNNNVQ